MWRMPASTKASYVGRLAPPGSPKTTSTPSAFRHSITASTARMFVDLLPSARGEMPSVPAGFRPIRRRPGLSADPEAHADREADDAPDGNEDQRGAHRDPEAAVADPRDREELETDHDARHDQRLFHVRNEERQRVEDASEHRHAARDRPPNDRRPPSRFFARVGAGLRPPHAHSRTHRNPEPDYEGRVRA